MFAVKRKEKHRVNWNLKQVQKQTIKWIKEFNYNIIFKN